LFLHEIYLYSVYFVCYTVFIANFFIFKWVTWIIENHCTCVSWFSLCLQISDLYVQQLLTVLQYSFFNSCPETTQEVYKYWIWILEVTLATLWQKLVTCILKCSKYSGEYSQNVLLTLICVLCSLKCTICFLCGYISKQIILYSVSVYWDNRHCQIVP
jgi:hypothetical protein